jgi:hypothetical protein
MELLSDAAHFLYDFHDLLALSAMNTYLTALLLSPKHSTLYKHYGLKLNFVPSATIYHATQWKLL